MSYFNLVEDFILEKEVNNASPSTITYYNQSLGKFGEFLKGREITQKVVNEYKKELMNTVKPTSVNTYLRGLRAFINYCDYPIEVKLVKEEEIIKEIYTEQELKLLLKKPKKSSFVKYKTWVMINLFLSTGIRLSSALEIKIGDINFAGGYIILRHTKNRKQQIIPMSKQLELILKEYLIRRKGDEEDYLLCSSSGTKLDTRTAQEQIQRYNKSRGVNKTSVHLFRHTFATMYLKNGGDIYRLQKLLGHSSIKVTEKYLHYTTAELQRDYNKLNPLDRLTFKIK